MDLKFQVAPWVRSSSLSEKARDRNGARQGKAHPRKRDLTMRTGPGLGHVEGAQRHKWKSRQPSLVQIVVYRCISRPPISSTDSAALLFPVLTSSPQFIQGGLDFGKLGGLFALVGFAPHSNRRRNENRRAAESVRNFRLVPALAKYPGSREDDVEAEYGGSGGLGEQDCPGFGKVARPARTINRECRVPPCSRRPNHFFERPGRASRAGAAGGAVSVLLNDPSNVFAVEILAGHHHNPASSPEPSGGKDLAMPESINNAFAGFLRHLVIFPAEDLPTQAAADQRDGETAGPSGNFDLSALPSRKDAAGPAINGRAQSGGWLVYRIRPSRRRLAHLQFSSALRASPKLKSRRETGWANSFAWRGRQDILPPPPLIAGRYLDDAPSAPVRS
jgi:hypothetical protein